jgi:hypothetical protein
VNRPWRPRAKSWQAGSASGKGGSGAGRRARTPGGSGGRTVSRPVTGAPSPSRAWPGASHTKTPTTARCRSPSAGTRRAAGGRGAGRSTRASTARPRPGDRAELATAGVDHLAARAHEPARRVGVEERHAPHQELRRPAVVVVQRGHVRRRPGADQAGHVGGAAEPAAGDDVAHAGIGEVRRDRRGHGVAGRAVLGHRHPPARERLRQRRLDRFDEVSRAPAGGDPDVDHGMDGEARRRTPRCRHAARHWGRDARRARGPRLLRRTGSARAARLRARQAPVPDGYLRRWGAVPPG